MMSRRARLLPALLVCVPLAAGSVAGLRRSGALVRGSGAARRLANSRGLALGDLNGDGRADMVTAESSTDEVTVLLSRQGLCDVQDLTGETVSVGSGYEAPRLSAARRTISASHCRVGTIRRARSDVGWARGRVIRQKPAVGSVLPAGTGIDLVVSRGPKR